MADFMSLVDVAGSQEKWDKYKEKVSAILPSSMKNEMGRYCEIYQKIATDLFNNSKVSNKKSILVSLYNAPLLGLNPDPVFGHIYFIPYKGVVTCQLGYKGMIKLSYNTGNIRNIRSGLVYDCDEFDYYEDEKGQHFMHRPKFNVKINSKKEVVGYSIFEDNKGVPNIHIMESNHIDSIKKMVLARMGGKNTPWSDPLFEPEMRKKTVIRRHWKTEPMSPEIATMIQSEEDNENGIVMDSEEIALSLDNIISDTKTVQSQEPDSFSQWESST